MAIGSFLGAQLGAKVGSKLVRPMIVVVCCALAIKLSMMLANPLNILAHIFCISIN
jgi:uncharacterized membrane protein YfcA